MNFFINFYIGNSYIKRREFFPVSYIISVDDILNETQLDFVTSKIRQIYLRDGYKKIINGTQFRYNSEYFLEIEFTDDIQNLTRFPFVLVPYTKNTYKNVFDEFLKSIQYKGKYKEEL